MPRQTQIILLFHLFLLIGFFLDAAPLSAQPARLPATAEEALAQTRAAIADRVRQRGEVSIIVGLDMPFRAMGPPVSPAARAQQASIRSGQDALLADLNGLNFRVNIRYRFIPSLSLTVDEAALDALYRSPRVASIELDRAVPPLMASSNPSIGTPAVWDLGYDGSGWAVAVFDSGVDLTHPWFNATGSKIVSEACYSGANGASLCPGSVRQSLDFNSGDDCGDVYGCDHGTHVAGTVAGHDGMGPDFGVARGADLIAVQVFSRIDDAGSCGNDPVPCIRTYSSDLLAAMGHILALSASQDIAAVNMSLGGGGYLSSAACDADNPSTKNAIDNLRAAGVATVISSGNNSYVNSISWPGCISSAISVGATSDTPNLAYFSNVDEDLDLLAPGQAITSAVPGVGTGSKQGTSMAAPHVAGAWAVLKQAVPAATVDDIEAVLKATGTPVDDTRSDGTVTGTVTGMPRINLDLALEQLLLQNEVVLYGTILDAGDGVTPIHPVWVDLINPVTGEDPPELGVINNPDGSYRITLPAEGDWKVLFNATDTANGYIDELYDGIACDNGSCDKAGLGMPVNVSLGGTELNVDLASVPLSISGTVTDEISTPMAGIEVEVLDSTGAPVGDTAVTAGDGTWIKDLPRPGTYYARTVGASVPNHQPEVWNNIPCDGCDPLTWGAPIEVIDTPVNNIDFQLDVQPIVSFGGTVTSEMDGRPLTPVTVKLLDAGTGAPTGLEAETDAEGRYQFTGIPVGSYKVAFDAHGEVSGFQDELYDNVPCGDLACNMAGQGTVVNILSGESELHVELWAPTTLSGTIVDARDGVTPVRPVLAELFDASTLDLFAQAGNLEDGTYQFNDVPPGDYLLFFNGLDAAARFLGQFNDGTVCPNPYCWPERSEVTPITIVPGPNIFDLQMRDFVWMSGTVTDNFGQPLANVPVEVFDALGVKQDEGLTGEDGSWSAKALPRQANYARIANVDLGGLVPEVWNNIPCIDCDPVATGMPIPVDVEDVIGIDFELEDANAAGDCSAGDLIWASGFEDSTPGIIEFIGNTSAVMQAADDAATFSVSYKDINGNDLDPSRLTWCLTDETYLQLTADGTNATVTATGFELGSADLVVRDPYTGAEARAPVLFADLTAEAVLLDGAEIIEGTTPEPGTTGIIRLARTPETDAIVVGSIIATTDGSPILVRVLSITIEGDELVLEVEQAALDEFYYSVSINLETAPSQAEVSGADFQVASQPSDSDAISPQGVPIAGALDLSCSAGLDLPEFSTNTTGEWGVRNLKWHYKVEVAEGITTVFQVRARGTFEAEIKFGEAQIQGGVNASCSLTLTPAGRLVWIAALAKVANAPGVAVGLTFSPRAEISAGLTGTVSTVGLGLPTIRLEQEFLSDIVAVVDPLEAVLPGYVPDFKVNSWLGEVVDKTTYDFDLPTEIQTTFDLELAASIGLDLEPGYGFTVLSLGWGPVHQISLKDPFDPLHIDYTGPQWDSFWKASGSWDDDVEAGLQELCGSVIKKVFSKVTTCSWINFVDPKEFYLWESEKVREVDTRLRTTCYPDECPIEVQFNEYLGFTIDAEPKLDGIGDVRLIGWKDGAEIGQVLLEQNGVLPYSNEWDPKTVNDPVGNWKLKAQLGNFDLFSTFKPYSTSYYDSVYVGNEWQLSAGIQGLGNVSGVNGEINCGIRCSTGVNQGEEIQLTAEPVPGWLFKEWSGGICGGSQAKTCQLSLTSDSTETAVFVPWPVITVEKRYLDSQNWVVGSVTSAPAGINCSTDQFTAVCSAQFEKPVVLQATAIEGKLFDRWENCPEPDGKRCTIIPVEDTTVVAVFVDTPKTLVVQKVDPSGGNAFFGTVTSSPAGINCHPDCEAEFVNFATVQLTASDSDGWSFVRWHADSEACANSTNPFCSVPMEKDVNQMKAVFSPGPQTLTVQRVKESNNNEEAPEGRIVSDPAGIDCGTDCSEDYDYNTWVTVRAEDDEIWKFVKWADDNLYCAGSTNRSCLVRMNDGQSLKAEFKEEFFNYSLVLVRYDGGGFPSPPALEIVQEIRNGDNVTVLPARFHTVGLKLDGQYVALAEGVYYADMDVFGLGDIEVWGGSSFQEWGSEDFPPAGEPPLDHIIEVYDATNDRTARIKITMRVSNDAYRLIAGKTFSLGGNYAGGSITFGEFTPGTKSGPVSHTQADNTVTNGTWTLARSTRAYGVMDCSIWTGSSGVIQYDDAGRANIPGIGVPPGIVAGGGHVRSAGHLRDHYCPGFEDFRIITNDH